MVGGFLSSTEWNCFPLRAIYSPTRQRDLCPLIPYNYQRSSWPLLLATMALGSHHDPSLTVPSQCHLLQTQKRHLQKYLKSKKKKS